MFRRSSCKRKLLQHPSLQNEAFFFLLFLITLDPRVDRYRSLWALTTSPPRNRCTFLQSSCYFIENTRQPQRGPRRWLGRRGPSRLGGSRSVFHTSSFKGRKIYCQPTGPNPINHRDDFGRPALRHGSLNSPFQVALHPPSYQPAIHSE